MRPRALRRLNVIAFTHKPVLGEDPVPVENRRLIAAVIKAGFTINLSADNAAHADKLAELGIAPVVTVLARGYARRAVRHRFKKRPDHWTERSANGVIEPHPAHGAWRQVEAAMAARDVQAGESWAFREHRTMAEIIAGEAA